MARVLTPAEIIRSATVTGAELCQMTGQIGMIAAGALADLLVVVDGDPLVDIALLNALDSDLLSKQGGSRMPSLVAF